MPDKKISKKIGTATVEIQTVICGPVVTTVSDLQSLIIECTGLKICNAVLVEKLKEKSNVMFDSMHDFQKFVEKISENSPPEFSKTIDDNFWEL